MGKTFRTTRCFGSSQPFAAAASRPGHVLDENGAVDYPDAATLDPAEGRADRGTRHPSRTAPSERRQRVAVAVYHQARIANAALDGQTQQDEFGYLFSETFDGLVGNLAGVGLDVSVSRRRSEGVCISYIEPAHPRLCADNRHRQERRDSESPLLACLDYPWNPAVFAAGQRCRLLRGLQGAAHFLVSSCGCVCVWGSSSSSCPSANRSAMARSKSSMVCGDMLFGSEDTSARSHKSAVPVRSSSSGT